MRYLIKRVAQGVAVILAIAALTFFVLNIVPGDPVRLMVGENADPQTVEQVRHSMGLDRPVGEQFVSWLSGMLSGDLGTSYTRRMSVADLISASLVHTVRLASRAFIIAIALGLLIGVTAAALRGTWVDRALMALAVAGISAPAFWLAIVLQIVFALRLGWFPLSGVTAPGALVLPSFALGVRYAASIARVARTSMLDVMGEDYIRTARAKGVRPLGIVLGHGLKNALVPIITIAGTQLGDIFTGSILIESIFSIPGIGSLLLGAITQRGLPLLEGGVMYVAAVCVIAYLVSDLLYAAVDPRIRLGGEAGR